MKLRVLEVMMKQTGIILFLICLIFTLSGCTTPNSTNEIANYLEELDAEEKFSGVVLIAKEGEAILERAYGLANRDYEVSNQLDTKFNLGSMNKMFTGVSVLQLVEQGKISVDDTVIQHLPEYPNQEVAENVTIHQLLTHTSGIGGEVLTQEWRESSKDQYKRLKDYLPLFVDKPMQFEPGTQNSYSNAGFIVLGLIIEAVTGSTYHDYVMENIYQTCGMLDTDSFEADRVVPNIAVGYAGNIRNYRELASNIYLLPYKGDSAGGGYSTAGDLLKFSNCLINHQLLNPASTELLLGGKADSPIPGYDGSYGYGFMDGLYNNHRIVGHGGSLPGVCSNLSMYIDLGYTAIVLSNSSNDCIRVINKIHETLLK
jgi:CubicO group peptidase (beta-lactamase class C family)